MIRLHEVIWTPDAVIPPHHPHAQEITLASVNEAEQWKAAHRQSVRKIAASMRGNARLRRSRRWRQSRRVLAYDFDRVLRAGPSKRRPIAWVCVTVLALGDWVDDKMYDTAQFGGPSG